MSNIKIKDYQEIHNRGFRTVSFDKFKSRLPRVSRVERSSRVAEEFNEYKKYITNNPEVQPIQHKSNLSTAYANLHNQITDYISQTTPDKLKSIMDFLKEMGTTNGFFKN